MSHEDRSRAASGTGATDTTVASPPLLSSLSASPSAVCSSQEFRSPFSMSPASIAAHVTSPTLLPAVSGDSDFENYRTSSPPPRGGDETLRDPLRTSPSPPPSSPDGVISRSSSSTSNEGALATSDSSLSSSSMNLIRLPSTLVSLPSTPPTAASLYPDSELTAQSFGATGLGSASAFAINTSLNGVPGSGGGGTSSPNTSPNSTASSGNPRRSLNAAFTLSPRNESEVEVSLEYNNDASSVCFDLDRHDPPIKQYYNLGNLEERRAFVTEGCVAAAQKMSTPRILDHLLPALLTAFEADDYSESFDDCSPCIARALPKIVVCMETRSTANLAYFMGLIMELCCSAEGAVAKVITTSLQAIFEMVEDDVLIELFLPFVLTMRVSFWSAPRVVAAGLLGHLAMRPAVLQASGLSVSDMFNYYAECSSDASAMVRAAVVMSLHDWVRVAAVHRLTLAEMPLPLLKSLATDDLSDTVRYLLIEEVVKLAQLIGPKSTSKYLLSTFVSAYMDPSWRVRYTAANRLGAMAALVLNADDLEVVLETLSRDEEPETRAAVARQLELMVQHCSIEVIQHSCVPVAVALSQDADPVVRRSAARHYHCFIFGGDEAVRTMCKALRALMQDTVFSVQENAIESLGDLVPALEGSVQAAVPHAALGGGGGSSAAAHSSSNSSRGSALRRQQSSASASAHGRGSRHKSPHLSSRPASGAAASNGTTSAGEGSVVLTRKRADTIVRSFMMEVLALGESRNWRIRNAVVRIVHHFCRVLSADQYRPLTKMLFLTLHDPVSAVRSQAVRALKEVAAAYGGEWAAQTAAELLQSDTLAPTRAVSYMWRVMMIQCLEVLLPVVSVLSPREVRRQQLLATTLPLLHDYVTDRVPNVRLAAAHALPCWYSWFDVTETERAAYNAAIGELQQDADVDVLNASHKIPYNRSSSDPFADGEAH
ncbi:protein phosphatase 2A regulatory subunit, putative [Leishmania tarentolae]|uniref:Protein phosphatase 2A regulatory subunit, putative n=1 Tax=Leishmania tarentolae TaxID=5689 RepID=A0A640KDL6_LEITA|nr:protein phosphatase 2A regulatory subunit, putative [Leishmania tarentolae]